MGTALNPPNPHEEPDSGLRSDRGASLLRIVSAILFLSLLLSIAVAFAIGRSDAASGAIWPALIAGLLIFATFTLPFLLLYQWTYKQIRSVEFLVSRARRVATGDLSESMISPAIGAEVAELARSLEELRLSILHQREVFEQQRETLGEILDGIGEGLVAINRHKRIVLSNRRLSDLFGIEGRTAGKLFLEVIRSQSLMSAFGAALEGAESTQRATIMVKGTPRQIEMRVFPISAGSEIAAVALFIDVTRIEHLERVRRDFIADFSHEVRTPLAGIRSAVDTLETGGLQTSEEDHLRKIISRQVTRLEKLVEEVGELKQIEAGEIQLALEPVDLRPMLIDLVDDFAENATSLGVHIVVSEGSAIALADIQKIQQVFSNLIDNALKHGGRGNGVRIEAREVDGLAIVRVVDFGDGIPLEEQERIFNRLYRIDRSRSQQVRGLGLGLAIARHLVEIHGGSIHVESQPGRGAAFEVRLPLAGSVIGA